MLTDDHSEYGAHVFLPQRSLGLVRIGCVLKIPQSLSQFLCGGIKFVLQTAVWFILILDGPEFMSSVIDVSLPVGPDVCPLDVVR